MRRWVILSISLLLAIDARAQQKSPPEPPGDLNAHAVRPVAPPPAVIVAPPARPNGPIQKSLVRITATEVEPDYRAPWNSGGVQRGIGAGFVIDGNRIMTNAHVVSNSRYLTVERDGDPNKYPGDGVVRGARLRSRVAQSRVARFFQEHGAAEFRRNSRARDRPSPPTVIRWAASACR